MSQLVASVKYQHLSLSALPSLEFNASVFESYSKPQTNCSLPTFFFIFIRLVQRLICMNEQNKATKNLLFLHSGPIIEIKATHFSRTTRYELFAYTPTRNESKPSVEMRHWKSSAFMNSRQKK